MEHVWGELDVPRWLRPNGLGGPLFEPLRGLRGSDHSLGLVQAKIYDGISR